MTIPFFDLKRQYESLKTEIEPKVIEVLRSCSYIGGKYVEDFEDQMREYLNTGHVVSCANGTDAIMLALRALNIGAGDEVITTPFTFFATAEAIAAVGAVPVFTDVLETDFNIDPSLIEEKITSKTKAVLPVHLFGCPCNMDEINSIAFKHDLHVIEDAAQAVGAEYNGRMIGRSDNPAAFSFYPAKNLGAFGDAGMVTTNNEETATILRAIRNHGMAKNGAKARELLFGERNGSVLEDNTEAFYDPNKYYNYLIAYNSRMDAIQAAVLCVKLKYLDMYNNRRKEIAELYDSGLKDFVTIPPKPENSKSCYHQYVIRTEKKKELCDHLSKKGIGTGAFYPVPLHLQKAFNYLGYREGDKPVSERLSRETVCLPIFPELTGKEIEYVISEVRDFFE